MTSLLSSIATLVKHADLRALNAVLLVDIDRQPAGADQRVDVIGHRNAVNLDAVESVSVVVLVERFGTLSGARSARSVRLDVAGEKLAGVEGSSMAVRAPPACVPM